MRRALMGGGGVTLQSISIAPVSPSLVSEGSQQFIATGHYSDGSTLNLTSAVAWASSDHAIATILEGTGGGLATFVSPGNVQISATIGSTMGVYNATVTGPAVFADLAGGALPSTIVAARTGSPVFVQSGASTLVAIASLAAALREDRGDGRGAGVWTLPPYANDIAAPFNHSAGAGWSHYGAGEVFSPAVAPGPDGATTYDADSDTSAADRTQVYQIVGAGSTYRAHSMWARDTAGSAPTAPGMLSGDPSGVSGVSLGVGASWRRIVHVFNGNPSHAYMGPGSAPGPTFDVSATGSYDLWGDQQVSDMPVDVPLVSGSTGAATLRVADASLGSLLTAGDLDIGGAFLLEEPTDAIDVGGYVYSMDTPSGAFSLRFDNTNGNWIFAARGTDLLTIVSQQYTRIGALASWRTWYKPSTGESGLQLRFNGALERNCEVTSSATVAAIGTPTGFYIGSNGGTSGHFPVRHTRLDVFTTPPDLHAEIVVLGDSIAAYHSLGQPLTSSFIYSGVEAGSRPGIASLAVVGNRLAQQQALYQASAYFGASFVKAVVIEAGINDINAGDDAATVIAKYQALVNLIHAHSPTAKVIGCKLTPDKEYSDTLNTGYYAVWQAVNAAIAGGGITGLDAVSSAADTLDDGAGNLRAQDDSGDHIHPVYSGRAILGAGMRAALDAAGVFGG